MTFLKVIGARDSNLTGCIDYASAQSELRGIVADMERIYQLAREQFYARESALQPNGFPADN